ncbi:hypothetical protein NP493_4g07008 [Ridgeia piscesae]|uniref:Uncharacterized protein n=1 Tax=Ridgeia piscesae TaxID=27915 RepID=A0AAD9PG65_RIDPI|nr:hypothetical protein NP493_4g07008 [Ridgeia piscesae]
MSDSIISLIPFMSDSLISLIPFMSDSLISLIPFMSDSSHLSHPLHVITPSYLSHPLHELVARFVSLIPFMSDSIIFAGLFDIWGTCEQFLRMLQGDEDEHAVLLVNYFLHLEKKAWLLLGTAIPEGRTAYVITQEGGDFWIWNASTGEHFRRGDSHCPVTAIHCLVNAENIWANIQPHCQPCRMQFDLTNTKNWKPFFCRAFPNPGLSSVQPAQLLYYPTDQTYVIDLQDRIETTLKRKVMDWRPRSITRWNRYCMKTFRTLLVELEEARGHGLQQKHCDELEKVLGAYKMTGFPINMPDSELDMIVEAVYATGVHNTENRDVEFALAVHVHPYPNSVLSIWIYIASLVKKR